MGADFGAPESQAKWGGDGRVGGNRVLPTLLSVCAAAVLVQGALAGAFVSGAADLRLPHTIVGFILPWLAIVPAVVAWRPKARARHEVGVRTVIAILPFLLWVQEVLGHVGAITTNAVHVPLGVGLFGLTTALAVVTGRRAT